MPSAIAMWVVVLASLSLIGFLLFWFIGERGRFLPSTWTFGRQAGFGLNALHAYIYGRWTPTYIKTLLRLPPPNSSPRASRAGRWLADHYHGKVLTHDHARAVVNLDHKIPLQDLEQIVPYPVARNIVLHGPPDIVAYECACRHAHDKHCQPTRVCMVIGKPITDFALEHRPRDTQRLTQAEALQLLEDEHRRGHLHSAWFKDAMLGRFYAICNCCKCCCGGVELMRRGVPMMAGSGYVARVDADTCAGCDDCVEACPFNAISRQDSGTSIDWDLCMGCGVCEATCSTGAISLARDKGKGVPLDVRTL